MALGQDKIEHFYRDFIRRNKKITHFYHKYLVLLFLRLCRNLVEFVVQIKKMNLDIYFVCYILSAFIFILQIKEKIKDFN